MDATNTTAAAHLPRNTMVRLPDGSTGRTGGYDIDGTVEVFQGRRVDYWHRQQLTVVG